MCTVATYLYGDLGSFYDLTCAIQDPESGYLGVLQDGVEEVQSGG